MKKQIQKSQMKVMPWKNRLGLTTEIAIDPENSDFTKNAFMWRLSSAQIIAKNTFSTFKGYDRILTVLSGEGLQLNSRELKPLEILKFHGENPVQCSLLRGAVEDIGVIFKRGLMTCEMRVLEVDQQTEMSFEEGTHFIKAITDKLFVDGSALDRSDIFLIEGPEDCELDSGIFPAQILVISIQKT